MEALIEIEQPVVEKLLLFENHSEISRLRGEVEQKSRMLNNIARHGLSEAEIRDITSSKSKIEQYVESQLLKENKEYARMVTAGISGITVKLSEGLESLKNALVAWESLKPSTREGNKYTGLIVDDNLWQVDETTFERECVMRRLKHYLRPERTAELKTLQIFEQYFNEQRAEPSQIFGSPFFAERFTCDSTHGCTALHKTGRFMLKLSYFMDRN